MGEALSSKKFRSDLYYRLNVAEIRLPPLAEWGDDILILARHFHNRHAARLGRALVIHISPPAQAVLRAYAWPGNVRELSNEMERLAALTIGEVVEVGDLSARLTGGGQPSAASGAAGGGEVYGENGEGGTLDLTAREAILSALNQTGGNKTRAAEILGLSREGLRKKMKKMGLD
jgi:DNA-binding NtrC family response regulator